MARPALSVDDLQRMRERLCAVALSIYQTDGPEAITFRRLAEAAEISHTLPYRYFENKDALLAQLRTGCFRQFETFVREHEKPSSGLLEHVRSIAYGYVEYARIHTAEYRLMFSTEQPSPDLYPDLLAARRRLFEHAVAVLQQYVNAGEIAGNARLLAHMLWIGLHGLMTLHVANQLVHGRKVDALIKPMIERILAPDPPLASKPRRFRPKQAQRSTSINSGGATPKKERRIGIGRR